MCEDKALEEQDTQNKLVEDRVADWLNSDDGIETVRRELKYVEHSVQIELSEPPSISQETLSKAFNL